MALPVLILLFATTVSSQLANPTFQLFTRRNPTEPQVLQLGNLGLLQESNFDPSLPTKIYAHGWYGSPTVQGYGLRNEYLEAENCNYFAVDWSDLAAGDFTVVATERVPIAGSFTASFIDFLIDYGASLDSFHLTGFSMGAHVVGIAGSNMTKGRLPRITGLDPSTRVFEDLNVDHRLDITDAQFLDVIHTTPSRLGSGPLGHVDFYPNGAQTQPGCSVDDSDCCSHCRAVYLMAESIVSTLGFRSVKCDSYAQYLNGECDSNESVLMGNRVPNTTRGTFYLTTNAERPYAQGFH